MDHNRSSSAGELARALARNAEAVCRHYLSNGRRHGHYWLVGDAENTPGRSLFVRLTGPEGGKGGAGKWTDAATGEHGDLLDIIARVERLEWLPDILSEARRFLSLPQPYPATQRIPVATGSPDAARRLFRAGAPITATLAERYLASRGISHLNEISALRFHPRCFYREHADAPRESWPAMLAAVTDLNGTITGVHRTWLARDGSAKAPLATPRRAMGHLLGHGVRFGIAAEVMAAGEGIETMLALRCLLPTMPMVAALSAAHLAALVLPPGLRRLYIARDNDEAGLQASSTLAAHAVAAGVDALPLTPRLGDFNDDLRLVDRVDLAGALRGQLAPEDADRLGFASAA
jgi:hypothetical protein